MKHFDKRNPQLFRELSEQEEKEFRQWARDHWVPNTEPDEVWHPIIRAEWRQIDRENRGHT